MFSTPSFSLGVAAGDAGDRIVLAGLGPDAPVAVTLTGGAGADTLAGPADDTVWRATGLGSGHVAGADFAGFETLEGAADNQDMFVLAAGASVGGLIEGGSGDLTSNGGEDEDTVRFEGDLNLGGGLVNVDGELSRWVGGRALDPCYGGGQSRHPASIGDPRAVRFTGEDIPLNPDRRFTLTRPEASRLATSP